jgi:TetR/AcrR family transcriptional repressor of nem operon
VARTKEFDTDEALEAAMRLFWRDGFEGTSTGALLGELGIARASLYATFGSKRELYLAALDRFITGEAGSAAIRELEEHEPAIEGIRAFLRSSAETPADAPAGCFAVNAGIEHGDADPEISRRLNANRRRLEQALRAALERARDAGDLAPGVDPEDAATMLVSLNTGLKALASAGTGQRARIRSTVAATMALLTATPTAAD